MVLRASGMCHLSASLTFCTAMLFLGVSLVPFVRPDLVESALISAAPIAKLGPSSTEHHGLPGLSNAESTARPIVTTGLGRSTPGAIEGSAGSGRWLRVESAEAVIGQETSTVSTATELAIDLQARTGFRPREVIVERLWRQPELPPLAQENAIPSIQRASPRVAPATVSVRLGVLVPKEIRRWEPIILRASQKYEVDPNLIAALMHTESAGSQNALSSMNAVGLMQVMGGSFDAEINVDQGVHIFAGHLRRYGAIDLALAAYNAGPGAVAKYGGIPPYEETHRHISLTIASYKRFNGV